LLPPLANPWLLPVLLLCLGTSGSFAAVRLAPWLAPSDGLTNEEQAMLDNAQNFLEEAEAAGMENATNAMDAAYNAQVGDISSTNMN
jgi:hypothetical protein